MVLERWRPRWALRTWRPFSDLDEWQQQIEDIFGQSMLKSNGDRSWMPHMDVFEKDDNLVVKAELPGMKEEDIDVSVDGDMLIIRGEKKAESEVKDEDYYRCERTYGSFYRSVSLPSSVDSSKIEANYENGILEVTLPKSPEVKPKKIAVSAKKKALSAAK
jgi:HSP20 family protein